MRRYGLVGGSTTWIDDFALAGGCLLRTLTPCSSVHFCAFCKLEFVKLLYFVPRQRRGKLKAKLQATTQLSGVVAVAGERGSDLERQCV